MTAPLLGELIEKMTGLALDRGGINKALDRFVADRMRALGMTMVESYVSLAADPSRTEQRKLIDANIDHQIEPLDEALGILRYQRETWALLLDQLGKTKAAAAANMLDMPAPNARMEASISMHG